MPAADAAPLRRLLMTADAVGGVWTYALELAQGLAAHGVDTLIAVLGPPPSDLQRADAARRAGVRLAEWHGRLEWMDDPWADVQTSGAWLMRLAQDWSPDVVHLNGYTHGAWRWPAPVLVAGHSCIRSWWRAVEGADAPPRFARYCREVTRGLHAADLVVAPSASMLAALRQHYPPLPHAEVIPNGRRPTLAAVAKEPMVLTAGRLWDAAKNVRAVCDVASQIPWPVYAAGPTAPADGETGVQRLGTLDAADMARWMGRASIYALPARYEPFGLSVLEAAQAGCALVLGDIDSLRENWDGAALFVPPDDRRALAAALRALIENASHRRELAARAHERSRQFTVERMVLAYLRAYRHLLTRGHVQADGLPARATGVSPGASASPTRTDVRAAAPV